MKKVFFCLLLLLAGRCAFAQKDSLQLDENNDYVYYKVAYKPELSADTIYARAWKFAGQISKDAKPVKGKADKAFNVADKIMIYNGISVVRKESGAVSYTLNFEAADGKYRYKFGSFAFVPYQRDRYGNMVPVPGIKVDIENLQSKYSETETKAIFDQIAAGCIALEVKLKQTIDKNPPVMKRPEVKKVHTGNW